VNALHVLVIGGGIGGLTTAIALRRAGHDVEIIERDPDWAVYGVGIIQQHNVVRAMHELGLLDEYVEAGFGFNTVEVFLPDGTRAAVIPTPALVPGYPGNIGIARPALHRVLGTRAKELGARVRLGLTATALEDDGRGVDVRCTDGSTGRYDIVVGADGMYSDTRQKLFPQAAAPEFTGQAVWRYNFPRSADVVSLCAYEGRLGIGLVPLSETLMYMYLTTAEPGNPRHPRAGIAAAMRARLAGTCPRIAALAEAITDDDGVVYKPLEWQFLEGAWHRGRVVLLGDAVHATTPHLGQGAGMAIEDSIVLAEELGRHATPEEAFTAYRNRRFERCAYIVHASKAICFSQLGKGPLVEQGKASFEMLQRVAQPI
jgi:2-polyprenyl-6-methoxyphenol hydroxylase-like FAD-dependent oxidoreductase